MLLHMLPPFTLTLPQYSFCVSYVYMKLLIVKRIIKKLKKMFQFRRSFTGGSLQFFASQMRGSTTVADIWKSLNGVICVHKPRDISLTSLKRYLTNAICESANKRCFPIEIPEIEMPIVEPHPISQAPVVVGLRKQPNYE